MTPPGRRLDEAVEAGDMGEVALAVYDLGRAAARHALRAQGSVPSYHPDVFIEADRASTELLRRFGVGEDEPSFPRRPSSYVFSSVRRAVSAYLRSVHALEPLPETLAEDDRYELPAGDVYDELMEVLVAAGDLEAANVLAVALDVARARVRPTARSIHAEIVKRHGGKPAPQDARWRIEKAWTRVRAAASKL